MRLLALLSLLIAVVCTFSSQLFSIKGITQQIGARLVAVHRVRTEFKAFLNSLQAKNATAAALQSVHGVLDPDVYRTASNFFQPSNFSLI